MLQTSLRVRCRNQRCRCKLPIPTENDHKAFCSPYCYNQFFHWKCAVCEVEILRGKRRKQPKCCRSPKCNKTYKNFTPTYTFGYHPSLGAISASEVGKRRQRGDLPDRCRPAAIAFRSVGCHDATRRSDPGPH